MLVLHGPRGSRLSSLIVIIIAARLSYMVVDDRGPSFPVAAARVCN